MKPETATVWIRVRSLVEFSEVPRATAGVIDEDYGSGVMVAWDLPKRQLPAGYHRFDASRAAHSLINA